MSERATAAGAAHGSNEPVMVQRIIFALQTELHTTVDGAALSWMHSGRDHVQLRRFPLPEGVFDARSESTLEVIAHAAREDPGQLLRAVPAGFIGVAFRYTSLAGGFEGDSVLAVDRSGRNYHAIRRPGGAVEARRVGGAGQGSVEADRSGAVLRSLAELRVPWSLTATHHRLPRNRAKQGPSGAAVGPAGSRAVVGRRACRSSRGARSAVRGCVCDRVMHGHGIGWGSKTQDGQRCVGPRRHFGVVAV